MSTYKNIRGKAIKSVSTNLSDTGAEGQIWFNTTDNQFKSVVSLEAFSSVSALNTARDALQIGSVGTQTAGIAFGGRTSPPESFKNETEEYNGSGWSESGNLNDARYSGAGFGTQTAAVMAGGNRPGSSPDGRSDVEEYDGSSWTNATDIPAGRYGAMGAGTLTAGIVAGGATGTYPFTAQSTSFEYDGTNWTSSGTMNKGRWIGASCGPQTAALFFGGSDTTSSPNTTNTESYNGTAFTTLSALPTATRQNMGSGDTSSAISYGGGNPSAVTTAFTWDGSSWSTSPATLTTARDEGSSSGTGSAAVTGGGSPPDAGLSIAEEYNKSTNVITQAAWSTGGTLGTARYGGGFGMTQDTAAIAGNDQGGGASAKTELYDGTSFTESGDLSQVGYRRALTGTQTAGLAVGAYAAPSIRNWVEEFNGSSWTATPGFPSITQFGSAAGPQTAAFYGGQYSSGTEDYNEWYDYDGSSWTASTPSSAGYALQRGLLGNAAAQTAAVACGGYDPASEGTNITESWNGSAWSTSNTVPTDGWGWGYAGTSTAGLIFCNAPGTTTNAISWDGTNWITAPSLSTSRASIQGGAGTSTSAIQMGGNVPPGSYRDASEEFNPGTSTLNVKTLTQS